MQPEQLRTLLAIRETGSLTQAARAMHLSHSAVSLQMKRLEQALGRDVLIKGKRPAHLTPFGQTLAERATPVLSAFDALKGLATPNSTRGEISVGFVPTTLQTLLPVVLGDMQAQFPDLKLRVSSGLSGDLAAQVERGDLSFAYLTAPASTDISDLMLTTLSDEPLFVIAPRGVHLPSNPFEVLAEMPFVGFSRQTWLGAQIETLLRPFAITPTIELDSIDAVENLVASGFGASIVPQRVFAPPLGDKMACARLAGSSRRLALAAHASNDRHTIKAALVTCASVK